MSDPSDRAEGPFLAILFVAFLIIAIIFFGPEIERWLSREFSGNRSGNFTVNGWDPFGSIIRGVESFGKAVGDLFFSGRR